MKKSTSKALYTVSAVLFTVISITGLAVVLYSIFVNRSFLSISSQTIYVVMAASGPLGLASCLRGINERSRTFRRISVVLHSLAVSYCALWLTFIYFISKEQGDIAVQAIIWLMSAACIKSLVNTVKASKQ